MTRYSLLLLLISACSSDLSPPKWLHGEWREVNVQNDTSNMTQLWKFDATGVYSRTTHSAWFRHESDFFITRTDYHSADQYRIQVDNIIEPEPFFDVFQRKGSMVYHSDSSKYQGSTYVNGPVRLLKVR